MKVSFLISNIISVHLILHVYTLSIDSSWIQFKKFYNKKYINETEEDQRRLTFLKNKKFIDEHNIRFSRNETSYQLALNSFADMEPKEFFKMRNRLKITKHAKSRQSVEIKNACDASTDNLDYRKKGAVTPVKDQGQCGSCWAFSTTGALEGAHFLKYGKLVSLSEQNLVDCSYIYGNDGCFGGWMNQAFQYIIDNKGIDTEESYPYLGEEQDQCNFSKKTIGSTQSSYVDITSGDEIELLQSLCNAGPISAAIDASEDEFMFYKSGVYDNPSCIPGSVDHGVLIVGYGTDEQTGKDYWLVKNSWDVVWGEDGYIKMSRNKGNQCNIASYASYPIV